MKLNDSSCTSLFFEPALLNGHPRKRLQLNSANLNLRVVLLLFIPFPCCLDLNGGIRLFCCVVMAMRSKCSLDGESREFFLEEGFPEKEEGKNNDN